MSDEFPISISKEFRYPLIINSMREKKKGKKERNRAKTESLLFVHTNYVCVYAGCVSR